MAKSSEPAYIYESPDKGRTVFRHELGKPETKELYKLGDEYLDEHDRWITEHEQMEIDFGEHYQNPSYTEWTWWDDQTEWQDMKKVAKDHPALQAAIDHAIMIYKLSKEENNDDDGVPF